MGEFVGLNLGAFSMIAIALVGIWKVGIRTNNAGLVDVFWSLLVLLGALYFITMGSAKGLVPFIITLMYFVWSLRLSFYIHARSIQSGKEDARYTELKNKWGDNASAKMLKFYLQQGAGALIFAWPAFFVSRDNSSVFGFFETLGFLIWLIAICGESLADYQMAQFKRNSDSGQQVCRGGLWAYSRHPNYFFEWLVWVGFFVYAFGAPWGLLSILGPVNMYYFLNYVTGVPLAEKESLKKRGSEYEDYQREVNAFFPWYPRVWRKKS